MNTIEILDNNLIIKDSLKRTYIYLTIISILNILSALGFIYKKNEFDYFYYFTGVLSLLMLIKMYLFDYKASIISISDIKKYKATHMFDNYKIILELKNGKRRDIKWFKTKEEFENCIEKINEAGIAKD